MEMKHTENIVGIKLDINATGVELSDSIKESVRKSLNRLARYYSKIEWADVYLENKEGKSTNKMNVKVRLGIPGNDPFASETGDNFQKLMAEVEEKLRRQLEKR